MPPSNPNDIIRPASTNEPVPTQIPQTSPLPQTPQPPQTPMSSPPSKKRKFLKWFGAIVVIVAIVATAALLLLGKDDKKQQQTVNTNQKKDIPVLRIGYTSGPLNSFYPDFQATSNFLEVNFQLFEGLVGYENKTKITPLLATGWSNPDNSTWVFNIRPNVKFHTGRTMTNEDVKLSLEAAKANSDLDYVASTIKAVETVGTDKVKVITNGPDTTLLNKLTYLYIFDTKSDKKNDPINGTGPYVTKPGFSPKEDSLDFVAAAAYHGGHVYTQELKMTWYKEIDQLVSEFNKGNLDIAGNLDQDTFAKLTNAELYTVVPEGTRFISINTAKKNSPLQNAQFREGLEYLLDKQALAKKEQGGGEVANQFIPDDIPGHDPFTKQRTRNVTKAKQLFTAAGYPNGASLNLIYSELDPSLIKMVQDQFAEGGIKLAVQDISDFDAFLEKVRTGNFDLAYLAYVSDFQDGTDFLDYVKTYAHYDSPDLNKLYDDARQTIDQPKRLELLKKASQATVKDTAVLPVFYLRDIIALKKGQNYVLSTNTAQTLTQSLYWNVYQK